LAGKLPVAGWGYSPVQLDAPIFLVCQVAGNIRKGPNSRTFRVESRLVVVGNSGFRLREPDKLYKTQVIAGGQGISRRAGRLSKRLNSKVRPQTDCLKKVREKTMSEIDDRNRNVDENKG
jgi:hypothetical protein